MELVVTWNRSNNKKPYLWWFRNPACGDSTGSNLIEKDRFGVSPRLSGGKGRRVVGFSECEAHLNELD